MNKRNIARAHLGGSMIVFSHHWGAFRRLWRKRWFWLHFQASLWRPQLIDICLCGVQISIFGEPESAGAQIADMNRRLFNAEAELDARGL